MKSILQTEKRCYVTGDTVGLHEHHIFYGTGNRKISERHGFKVYLRHDYHNTDSDRAVHLGNKVLDLELKRAAQREFEKNHSRADFMRLIGRNYLD